MEVLFVTMRERQRQVQLPSLGHAAAPGAQVGDRSHPGQDGQQHHRGDHEDGGRSRFVPGPPASTAIAWHTHDD